MYKIRHRRDRDKTFIIIQIFREREKVEEQQRENRSKISFRQWNTQTSVKKNFKTALDKKSFYRSSF